jgi:hypothetical protein
MSVKCKLFLFIFFLLFFISASEASAQVVINEFSSWDTSGDWVELYSEENIDISEWILRDTTSVMKIIDSGKSIGPSTSQFFIVEVGNRLNRNGDVIELYRKDGVTQEDKVSYGDEGGACLPGPAQSIGRYPDGMGSFVRFSSPTKKASNEGVELDPCPTPTPELTPTPTLGPTSTPTPTPTKTPTATPKPTVKAVVTKKPEVISGKTTSDEDESEILGLREGLESPSPTPIPELEEKGKIPITAVLFVLGGLVFIGVAGYPFLKSMKKRYNIKNGEETEAEGGFKSGDN